MAEERRNEPPVGDTSMVLEGDRTVVISRTFRAPPRLVFDAWTKADLVKRWWAPKSRCVEVVSISADVRAGGAYRYVLRAGEGEIAFSGTYREVTPYTRLVYTQIFEVFPDAPVVVTVDFEEHQGKTRLTSHEVYPSPEAREGALSSGMEDGMRETMNLLDELVLSMM